MIPAGDAHQALLAARRDRQPRTRFSTSDDPLDAGWGHQVQALDRKARTAEGEVLVGMKLGLNSRAKQQTMGVPEPIVGFLTDAMDLDVRGAAAVVAGTTQARVEPEIAFRLAVDLDRAVPVWRIGDLVDGVAVALEVIDSRFVGYRFGLPDVLADNTSAAGFTVGEWTPLRRVGDLATAGCVLDVDGAVVHTAAGAAILGHPLLALSHLSRHLAAQGEVLPAGSVVLAGALTDAVPVRPGAAYGVAVRGLGSLTLRIPAQV
ncbi:2-keto-4-pentenoate hydratase [Klenkia taihuensis]|uniref:2-oxo-3-hexenedioate decarboxylase n=1 Tax=Klenkia taihuensis TaxID=1225127 RepID=A0A1I1U2K0_9ACTN|nr:fumarylacetoacetate hydrolase family protein [Klenkia taihuensis]GHE06967.1 4-oxalocrotonate decarboxylase [Klenkia taihuensis]SFD64999.1 2-oxo-3-hexenedioate decarboxylase [Klenkia taihuensis]